jgi:Concanavalin A-like lectin/glucanases superfamily
MTTQIRLAPVILLGLAAICATAARGVDGQVDNEAMARARRCVPPPNTTMVAWYSFDTVAGTLPLTPNLATGNSGEVFGATLVPGEVARALSFNGSNNYVESPSSIVTNFGPAALSNCTGSGSYSSCSGDFSIDAWIQVSPAVASSQTVIVDKRSGSQPAIFGYALFLNPSSSGGLELGLQLADGLNTGFTNFLSGVVSPPLTDGRWHHIAVTVQRKVALGILWYHNGVPFGNPGDPTTRQGSLANASPLRIGTRTAAPPLTGWFKGNLDELEIFNRVLTPAEVRGIHGAGPSGKCK